jgi:Myb-like DNA-binding protein FlbD
MGKRWAEIARRLGNRSDNAVKNWWNGSMNRKRRGPVVQTGHASRTFHGRIEAPYPRASMNSSHLRRPSWSLSKSHAERSPVHLVHDGSSSTDSSRRLAPILTYPSHGVESAMTSPAFSETSSLDPPSMVSDHNSVSSASPRTLPSPQILSIPVDLRQAYVERRGSAPSFHFQSATGDEIYMSSESTPSKRWGPDFSPPVHKPVGHHYSNSVPEAPTTPPEDRSSRDVRMGVNSLLN